MAQNVRSEKVACRSVDIIGTQQTPHQVREERNGSRYFCLMRRRDRTHGAAMEAVFQRNESWCLWCRPLRERSLAACARASFNAASHASVPLVGEEHAVKAAHLRQAQVQAQQSSRGRKGSRYAAASSSESSDRRSRAPDVRTPAPSIQCRSGRSRYSLHRISVVKIDTPLPPVNR